MALGKIIRQQREKLGLTLDEVSRRTGFSKPYISTVETGKIKNPPGDALLGRLEEILKFEPGLLMHIAHLEKLPADVRAAFEKSVAENDEWRALIRQVVHQGGNLQDLMQTDKFQRVFERLDSPVEPNAEQIRLAGKLIPVIN